MIDINPISCQNKFEKIYLSFYQNNKKSYMKIDNFKNYFYFSDFDKPILSKALASKQFGSKKDSLNFDNTYENDISPAKRFMIDNFGKTQELPYQKLRVGFFDIEALIEGKFTINGKYPISAISIYDSQTDKIYTFAYKDGINKTNKDKCIKIYDKEEAMLNAFLKFMEICKFDALLGWNSSPNFIGSGFDIPYLCNRLTQFKLLNKLSPFNLVEKHWRNENEYVIYGLTVLDYMGIYNKFNYKTMESYRLDFIADTELGEGKLKFNGDLNQLYKNDIDKYIEYNRQDVMLMKKMEDKLQYVSIVDEMRRLGVCNFDEALNSSVVIDNLLLKFLNNKGYIVRSKRKRVDNDKFQGAFVLEPKAGIYEGVVCLDFTSLYPFCIINGNVSIESLITTVDNNYKPKENEIKTPNNALFTKDIKGIFPSILKWLFSKRVEYQKLSDEAIDKNEKQVYDMKQYVYKAQLLNSFYGFMGFSAGRFFDITLAEAVTSMGKSIIKYVISELEKENYMIITADTDSCYLTKKNGTITKEEGIKLGSEIRDKINEKLKKYCKDKMNILDANFDFKYEGYISRSIFLKKKNYIVHWTNKKGKDCDEIQMKGVQVKKSDTSKYTKKYLTKIYDMLIHDESIEEIDEQIKRFRNDITTASMQDIGIPFTIKDMAKYQKNEPIQLRAAKVWELNFAETYNCSFENTMKGKRYSIMNKGLYKDEKEPVIGIPEGIEMPVSIIIDYERMREQIVESPLTNILDVLNDIRVKKMIDSYMDYNLDDLIYNLYINMKLEEVSKDLHKKNNLKKFIKFIEESIQNRIFNSYCNKKNYFNKNLVVEITKRYFENVDLSSVEIKKEEEIKEINIEDSFL